MSPQGYKSNTTTKVMASNGYADNETLTKECKNHSPPCESFNCMCA